MQIMWRLKRGVLYKQEMNLFGSTALSARGVWLNEANKGLAKGYAVSMASVAPGEAIPFILGEEKGTDWVEIVKMGHPIWKDLDGGTKYVL